MRTAQRQASGSHRNRKRDDDHAQQGDMLVIPRGTPHKRSTAGTVTFTLISPQGT